MPQNKKELKTLEKEILNCKNQLKELEPYIKNNASMNENYNRILIKKAILIDKYKKLLKNPIKECISKVFQFRREKLICDYFPNC